MTEIEVEVNGILYKGWYEWSSRNSVTVHYDLYEKSATHEGPSLHIQKVLLQELVKESLENDKKYGF